MSISMEQVDVIIARLRDSAPGDRSEVRAALLELATGPDGRQVREHLDNLKRGELLEVQWEFEEILEAAAPPPVEAPPASEPEPEPEPEPTPPPEDQALNAADLNLVYDDPRGLMLHNTKDGKRFFMTQVDPRTAQPQTFELHPDEVAEIKSQLEGSPYWILGN